MTLQLSDASDVQVLVGRPLKYQLTVVGSTVADVVTSAGGWLFDRAMAGWEVNVLIEETDGMRPLEILGARCVERDAALGAMKRTTHPHALAVATGVFDSDERVRQLVLGSLRRGSTELSFWGAGAPSEIDRAVSAVEHPLTAAARVFKAHALSAAVRAEPASTTETFFRGGRSFR